MRFYTNYNLFVNKNIYIHIYSIRYMPNTYYFRARTDV